MTEIKRNRRLHLRKMKGTLAGNAGEERQRPKGTAQKVRAHTSRGRHNVLHQEKRKRAGRAMLEGDGMTGRQSRRKPC